MENQKPNQLEQILKFNDEQQYVFGWASISKMQDGSTPFEWQDDVIDMGELENAMYKFNLDSRVANDMHQEGTDCGRLIESCVFTKEKMAKMGIPEGTIPEGAWVGFKIDEPEVYAKVKSGVYKMFSIEGAATRVPMKE